ncbi:unnamed protein product [Rhodiola kirilowii]
MIMIYDVDGLQFYTRNLPMFTNVAVKYEVKCIKFLLIPWASQSCKY